MKLAPQPTAAGNALVAELLYIHGLIREGLSVIRKLADDVDSGASPDVVRARIEELKSNSILWTLRVNCLRFCAFVHGHHNLESAAFFPQLRKVNPMLNPVVDRLEADHRTVSRLLNAIEESSRLLQVNERARVDLSHGLATLAAHLLEHLAYEEESISPTLATFSGWPSA